MKIENHPFTAQEVVDASQVSPGFTYYFLDEHGSDISQVVAAFTKLLKEDKVSFTKLLKDVEAYVPPGTTEKVDLAKRPRWNGIFYKPNGAKILFAVVADPVKK